MSQMYSSGPDETAEAKLPRRDWILLPLLSIFTIAALALSTEWYARRVFPQSSGDIYQCIIGGNILDGARGAPNSDCRGNRADSPITEYRLNSCGHRAGIECGPKPKGTYRIVMIGSSFAIGEGVPMEKTVAAVLPADISSVTGRKVDLYNEGMFSEIPKVLAPHFDQVMAAQPDMVLWILTPEDVKSESVVITAAGSPQNSGKGESAPPKKLSLFGRILRRVRATFADRPATEAATVVFHHYVDMYSNRLISLVLLRHVLDADQSRYVESYLANPDAEFLNAKPGIGWKNNLKLFDRDDAEMEASASAAGIPLVVALLPNRAQAAIISMGKWPTGIDPFKVDGDLRAIVSGHGGIYVDILPEFRNVLNSEQYFYLVNGHPDERGSALVAGTLAKALTGGAVPALSARPRDQLEQAR